MNIEECSFHELQLHLKEALDRIDELEAENKKLRELFTKAEALRLAKGIIEIAGRMK